MFQKGELYDCTCTIEVNVLTYNVFRYIEIISVGAPFTQPIHIKFRLRMGT